MKNKVESILFVLFITIVMIVNIIVKDNTVSYAERRKLQTLPEFKISTILDSTYFTKFDKYTVDQFVFRDGYRSVKSYVSYNILNNYDNNGYFMVGDNIFKMMYPLNENDLNKTINKINSINEKYLSNNNVYYSIIPDKNYYINDSKHLKIDYNKMFSIINNGIENSEYIDITSYLTLDDYYKTDLHWKQESIEDVSDVLLSAMNNYITNTKYNKEQVGYFYGTYSSQSGFNTNKDELNILTNSYINDSEVLYLENNSFNKVYNLNKFDGMDPYDVFLDGASSLIEVNTNNDTDKELIVFRDSFGSSLVPLLLQNYRKITIIDVRYISSDIINSYVEFNNQDVLFIYSTLIFNTNILK